MTAPDEPRAHAHSAGLARPPVVSPPNPAVLTPGDASAPGGLTLEWTARRVLVGAGIVATLVVVLLFLWYARDVLLLVFAGMLVGVFLRRLARLVSDPTPIPTAGILALVPAHKVERLREVLDNTGETLWWWLIGRLISMTFIGVVTGVGLRLLGVPLAFILGLLAALLSFIPNLGPILSAPPAILLALAQGPQPALRVAALYAGVQVVESYVLDPIIDRKTIYLPPAFTITAQLVMALFAGLLGVTLATPLAAAAVLMVTMLYVQDVLRRRDIRVRSH